MRQTESLDRSSITLTVTCIACSACCRTEGGTGGAKPAVASVMATLPVCGFGADACSSTCVTGIWSKSA